MRGAVIALAALHLHGFTPYNVVLAPRGRPPRGVISFVHGGGWHGQGAPGDREQVKIARRLADSWVHRGYIAVVEDYRGFELALGDLTRFEDAVGRRWPRLDHLAIGLSAGGQLAMLLARRRQLTGVIALAAPVDLTAPASTGLRAGEERLCGANLRACSPAIVGVGGTPTRAVYASGDYFVPPSVQAASLRRRHLPGVTVRVLPNAPASFATTLDPRVGARFVHSYVATGALVVEQRREAAFFGRLLSGAGAERPQRRGIVTVGRLGSVLLRNGGDLRE